MPDLDSEAIDFRAASESFASVRRLTRHDLATLHLVTNHQGRRVPIIGGMLLFGLDRPAHFPDAWIQAGRFAGVDKSRIADHAELRELPVSAIDQAIRFIEKHSTHGAEIGRGEAAFGSPARSWHRAAGSETTLLQRAVSEDAQPCWAGAEK